MKNALKTSITFSIILSVIFIATTASAQYPGMGAFRAQQSQQFANQQMRMQMQMMNMRGVTGTVQEFDFEVVMLDSTIKLFKSAIYTDSATKKHFIIRVDRKYKKTDSNRYQKIYPAQTKSLNYVVVAPSSDGTEPGKSLPARITDSCWMFKTVPGAISAYTYDGYNGLDEPDQYAIVGIQLNDGPVLPYTEQNLKAMVGQNAKALDFISQKKYFKAIKRYNSDINKQQQKDKHDGSE